MSLFKTILSSVSGRTPPSVSPPTPSPAVSSPAMPIVARSAVLTLDFIVIGGGECWAQQRHINRKLMNHIAVAFQASVVSPLHICSAWLATASEFWRSMISNVRVVATAYHRTSARFFGNGLARRSLKGCRRHVLARRFFDVSSLSLSPLHWHYAPDPYLSHARMPDFEQAGNHLGVSVIGGLAGEAAEIARARCGLALFIWRLVATSPSSPFRSA